MSQSSQHQKSIPFDNLLRFQPFNSTIRLIFNHIYPTTFHNLLPKRKISKLPHNIFVQCRHSSSIALFHSGEANALTWDQGIEIEDKALIEEQSGEDKWEKETTWLIGCWVQEWVPFRRAIWRSTELKPQPKMTREEAEPRDLKLSVAFLGDDKPAMVEE